MSGRPSSLVEPIVLRGERESDVFVKNHQGLHVPLSTLSTARRRLAWKNRIWLQRKT
jgi:hypothetical protein